jgi:hypothetical protein
LIDDGDVAAPNACGITKTKLLKIKCGAINDGGGSPLARDCRECRKKRGPGKGVPETDAFYQTRIYHTFEEEKKIN